MAKWKLFGKSKSKKEENIKEMEIPTQEREEISQQEPETIDETNEETEELPVTDYYETLYSNGHAPKKSTISPKTSEKPWKRRSWESVHTIEKNIEDIGKKKIDDTASSYESWNINRKVDKIISDIDVKRTEKYRKPANVIYVVSKPQPGQVKGDWAVRSHSKIFSHHRKKQTAIKAARKVAKEKGATVLVQNTDGTFSEGFKPR